MSNSTTEHNGMSIEEIKKELEEMKGLAAHRDSPVAIFMPIVTDFGWCPAMNDETSTIVLASNYGSKIDNGCIIYNPDFVHQLYKDGDMTTFYAIIATIGLGVKCGYYDYRNGEGIEHTKAVQIMMAHHGILNMIKTGNASLDASLTALQQAYSNEELMNAVKQVYTLQNTVQVEDPDTGAVTTKEPEFGQDDWNLETIRKYIGMILQAVSQELPQAVAGEMTPEQEESDQQETKMQQSQGGEGSQQPSKWGAPSQQHTQSSESHSGGGTNPSCEDGKTPRQMAQQARTGSRQAQQGAAQCAQACGNSPDAKQALSEMQEASRSMTSAANQYQQAASDGDQPGMEAASKQMQQASQKMQSAAQHMQQAAQQAGGSNAVQQSLQKMQQGTTMAQQASTAANSQGNTGSSDSGTQSSGQQDASSSDGNSVAQQAQSAANDANQGAAQCAQACGNSPESQSAQSQIEKGARNLEQGARRFSSGVDSGNTAQQQLGAQQMQTGMQQINSGAQQMQQAMSSSGANSTRIGQIGYQRLASGAQQAASISNEAQSAADDAASEQSTGGESVNSQAQQAAQNARTAAAQCARSCGETGESKRAQQTIEQGARQLEEGASQYAQGCRSGDDAQRQSGAAKMQQGANTIERGAGEMQRAMKNAAQQPGGKPDGNQEDDGQFDDRPGVVPGGDGTGDGDNDMPYGQSQSTEDNNGSHGEPDGTRSGISKLQEAAQEAQQAATNGSRGTSGARTQSQSFSAGQESGYGVGEGISDGDADMSDARDGDDQHEGSDDGQSGNPGAPGNGQGGQGGVNGNSGPGGLGGLHVNIMSDVKLQNGKAISGLNKNLAKFANETNTFSQIKPTAATSSSGTDIASNLQNVTREINSNIESKKSEPGAETGELETLNALTNEINEGQLHISTGVNLTIARRIVNLASNASRPSNEESGVRNMRSPTHQHFSNGSFNFLEDYSPSVLLAIDASGSMWYPKSVLVGASNLLTSIAKILKGKGVKMDYVFWDDGCDIPRPFSVQEARNLAKGNSPTVTDGEGILKTSVGGGGTNIYSVADRLSPYVYPPELNDDGSVKRKSEREVKYTPEMKRKFKLKYGYQYDLIIIYSDFWFPGCHKIPSNAADIRRLFDQIRVSKTSLCCICCNEFGDSETPDEFKKLVTWIPYDVWKSEIEVYSCQPSA